MARLHLIPFGRRHLAATWQWINDPRVSAPFGLNRKISRLDHQQWWRRTELDESQMILAIVLAGKHIGNVGFKDINARRKSAEFWIYLDPERHGEGLGAKATQLALRAIGPRASQIGLRVLLSNHRAYRIYAKLGFQFKFSLDSKSIWMERRRLGRPRPDLDISRFNQSNPPARQVKNHFFGQNR